MLEDIAIVTGGTGDLRGPGHQPGERSSSKDLGKAKKVTVDKENTTIIEGAGKTATSRAASSRSRREIETTTSDYDREKLQERLAKLAGGVAQIKVGAATEVAMKEKKARVEDALHACRAAVEEGILPGGGVAVLRAIAKALDKLKLDARRARSAPTSSAAPLDAPIKQIAENAGVDGSVVAQKVKEGDERISATTP